MTKQDFDFYENQKKIHHIGYCSSSVDQNWEIQLGFSYLQCFSRLKMEIIILFVFRIFLVFEQKH